MKDSALLIRQARVLDLQADPHQPVAADILVIGNKIVAVGDNLGAQAPAGAEVIEAVGQLAIPGLVNAHYHSHDALLKGAFDTSSLERWALNALPRSYPPRSDRELRARTLIGAAECLRSGITTVQDMLSLWPLTRHQAQVVCEAYEEAGLRVVLGLQTADVGPLDTVPFWRETIPDDKVALLADPTPVAANEPSAEIDAILAEMPDSPEARVTWAVCPSSPERCSRDLLMRLADVARRHGVRLYSHVAISRAEALGAQRIFAAQEGSPIVYLDQLGVLGPDLTLAHGVWLDDRDCDLIARSGARLVLNPMSNLKTKNGIASFRRYHEAGVRPGLGCDNCSCSDAQNMFHAMKIATLVSAIADSREGGPTARDALMAATADGARALGLEHSIGVIRPGFKADITLLDLGDPVFRPLNSAARQLVYGESGRSITNVIVDGRIVMRDRRLTTIDETALSAEIDAVMPAFARDAAAVQARVEALSPYIAEADRRIWAADVGLSRFACA